MNETGVRDEHKVAVRVCGAVAHRWAIMGPLCVKVRPGGAVAVLPCCACDCERDLADPETAFLGLL